MNPSDVTHRFRVDIELTPETLHDQLVALSQRRPAGHVATLLPFGFCFRRDPDALFFVATGATLAVSILLLQVADRLHHASLVAYVFSTLSALVSAACFVRFVTNQLGRLHITSEHASLVVELRFLSWVTSRRVIAARDIVGVHVLRDPSSRVVLAGPRHAILDEVFRARQLDPELLAPWLAEMVAIVARHATTTEPANDDRA